MKMDLVSGEYDIIHVSSGNDINSFKNDFEDTMSRFKFRRDKLIISFDGKGDILLNIELFKKIYLEENYFKNKYNYRKICYSITTSIPNKNILDLFDFVFKYNIELKINYILCSPIEYIRKEYFPNNKVSVCEALDYLNHFNKKTSSVIINYNFMDGINDSQRDLIRLCELLNDYTIPIKFTIKNDVWINGIHSLVPNLKIIV